MPAESHPSGVLDNRSGGGSPGRVDGPLPMVGFCPFPCFCLVPVSCVFSHPAWAAELQERTSCSNTLCTLAGYVENSWELKCLEVQEFEQVLLLLVGKCNN